MNKRRDKNNLKNINGFFHFYSIENKIFLISEFTYKRTLLIGTYIILNEIKLLSS